MAPKDERKEPGMQHPSHAAATPRGRVPSGGELAGLSVYLAAAVVVPLLVGVFVDNVLRTSPLFLFVGLLLGIVMGVMVVITRLREYL
jgi:F0F1-type ATP synthase assembly protein I